MTIKKIARNAIYMGCLVHFDPADQFLLSSQNGSLSIIKGEEEPENLNVVDIIKIDGEDTAIKCYGVSTDDLNHIYNDENVIDENRQSFINTVIYKALYSGLYIGNKYLYIAANDKTKALYISAYSDVDCNEKDIYFLNGMFIVFNSVDKDTQKSILGNADVPHIII